MRTVLIVLLILLSMHGYAQQKNGIALIDSIKSELTNVPADTNKVNLLNTLSNLYCTVNPDTGALFALQALDIAKELEWRPGIGGAYTVLGNCAFYKSDFKKSLEYWNQALTIFEQIKYTKGKLKVLSNLGALYTYQGDYTNALKHHFQSLKYAEELGEQRSIATSWGNIAATYEYLKDHNKALEYYLKAVAMFEKLGIKSGLATSLGNIGAIYIELKNFDAAIAYELRAIKADEELGNNEGMMRDMANVGVAYIGRANYDEGLRYYFKALTRSRATGFRTIEAKVLSYLGETFLALSKDSATKISAEVMHAFNIPASKTALQAVAASYLRESIAINIETGSRNELLNNYNSLSEAQLLSGNFKDALESYKRYTAIKDSVFSAENRVTITNMETQRELELKDKQIIIDQLAVAKKRNERVFFIGGFVLLLAVVIFIIRNIRLSTAKELSENKLNAFQARMNPHFIFNSLSSIQSLILNNETESSIDYLSEFSTLMRQILDNSFKSKVVLKTEINMLRSYIELEHLRFEGFKWSIEIDENVQEESVEVPGMVVQPFVENAILHGLISKGNEGVLKIAFTQEGRQIICTVEDNGIGREKSFEINQKRNRNRQSHGVDIAANRLTLLNDKKKGLVNKVAYIDKTEQGIATGTKVIIQLPIL